MKEQTWWNENIKSQINVFKNWVGDETAESKRYAAKYLRSKQYNTFLDVGCGTATMSKCLLDHKLALQYTGVDSCDYLINLGKEHGIDIINSDVRNMNNILTSSYDFGFSRHVFEHQESFNPALSELIRVSKYEACHIFFIKPSETQLIHYNSNNNLYHNTYSIHDINAFLQNNKKVNYWEWVNINKGEVALHIILSEN
jgi:ubiquinone/menaquinone biosynthesis C-methylase UbiE